MIDAIPPYPVAETPTGRGKVETYTVMHAGANPALIIVVGTMVSGPDSGKRFVANMCVAALACVWQLQCGLHVCQLHRVCRARVRVCGVRSLNVARDLVDMKLDLMDVEGDVATAEDGKCNFALDKPKL